MLRRLRIEPKETLGRWTKAEASFTHVDASVSICHCPHIDRLPEPPLRPNERPSPTYRAQTLPPMTAPSLLHMRARNPNTQAIVSHRPGHTILPERKTETDRDAHAHSPVPGAG